MSDIAKLLGNEGISERYPTSLKRITPNLTLEIMFPGERGNFERLIVKNDAAECSYR